MNEIHPKVQEYLNEVSNWKKELSLLREIIVECHLTEDFKWRNPCYTYQNTNIVIIGGFKDRCMISFFKGNLLNDFHKVLKKAGEHSPSARVISFNSVEEISRLRIVIREYIYESVEIEKEGVKIDFKKGIELDIPIELVQIFEIEPEFRSAFYNLTEGRQRGYLIYFSGAKKSVTVKNRILRHLSRIMDGKGMNDCTCGLSKRMPSCDGSHNMISNKN